MNKLNALSAAQQKMILDLSHQIALVIVISLIVWIVSVVAYWKIFNKIGEKGWKSLIPFYSEYVLIRATWKTKWFWTILVCLILTVGFLSVVYFFAKTNPAFANIFGILACITMLFLLVLDVISLYRVSVCFGHGAGWTVGLVLVFPVFVLMLAFDSSKYVGNIQS